MENDGQFVLRCEANNSIPIQGIAKSGNTILTVDGEFEVIFKVSSVAYLEQNIISSIQWLKKINQV